VLNLTVLPNSNASLQASICQGTYYVFGGDTLRNTGYYYDTLVSLNGCDSVVALQLTVFGAPQAIITAMGSTVLCQGDSVMLSAGSGLNLTYTWRRNGVLIPTATSSFYYANLAGSYDVFISDTNGCSALSNALVIQINPLPQPVASLNGRVLSLSGGPFATYQWYRNSMFIAGATQATYTADSGGVYACLVSQGGCSALSNLVVVFGVGIGEIEEPQWGLYPNPSRGLLMLRGVVAGTVRLFDISGRIYHKGMTASIFGDSTAREDQKVDLSDVPAGIYWVELHDDRNRFLGRKKVIRVPD
jgi:hypothetical protein